VTHPFPIGTLCKIKPKTALGNNRLSVYVDTNEEHFDAPYGDLSLLSVYKNETFIVLGNLKWKSRWSDSGESLSSTLILHPFHGAVWINTLLIEEL